MIQLSLFRQRAFTFGNLAGLAISIGRGGMQFVLIIWLQGIWLPLHGYDYADTPLWAGIFMLPLTAGLPRGGPGLRLSVRPARFPGAGHRRRGTVRRQLPGPDVPADRLQLLDLRGADRAQRDRQRDVRLAQLLLDHGQRARPVRGVASGMRATFQNSGTAVSIGVFFSLMIAGLARSLPHTLTAGLRTAGRHRPTSPPRSAACRRSRPCSPPAGRQPDPAPAPAQRRPDPSDGGAATHPDRKRVLPDLISGPFHSGLVIVFAFGATLAFLAAIASLLRGAGTGPTAKAPGPRKAATGDALARPDR
jgi:hypothetical protein